MSKVGTIDKVEATLQVVKMREDLIEQIEKALSFRQTGSAGRALQVLKGFDSLAERLGLLDDRQWEREELRDRLLDILSLHEGRGGVYVERV